MKHPAFRLTARLGLVSFLGLLGACDSASTKAGSPDAAAVVPATGGVGLTATGGVLVTGGITASGGVVKTGGTSTIDAPVATGGTKTIDAPIATGVDTSSVDAIPLPPGTVTQQGDIVFTSIGGWLEYGFAQWNALTGATSYNVYYKLASAADTAYAPVDAPLVRGTRVDLPGLAGKQSYDLKVSPIVGGTEQTSKASVARITTLAHDRSGFAFHAASPNLNASGAYNADGTLKTDALILYVTETTKDTITMPVSKGKTTNTYTGLGAIMAARQSAGTTIPLSIRVIGLVTAPAGVDSLSLLNLKTNANITMEGIGTDAQCNGWGLNIRAATNVEIRNLSFANYQDDAVSIQVDNRNIWIHHNDFMVGANGGGDKELGDGSCDIKANSSYITVSYNHFQGTGKSSLTGQGDSAEFFVTFHHNFFDASHSRHPRARWGTVHVYNNYYKGNTTYGAAASEFANLFVQNNTFENVVRPMLIASQGHDFKDLVPAGKTPGAHESILSGEAGGSLKQEGNDLDAVSASWFDPKVDTGNGSSNTYNNFETKFGTDYPCALESAAESKAKALELAGRLN